MIGGNPCHFEQSIKKLFSKFKEEIFERWANRAKAISLQFKSRLPASEWMLKMGVAIIGTETELILKSRWVLPTKILQTGFQFKYSLLEDALKSIISKTPRKQFHLF
jgi:hypothetical protein